MKRTGLFAIVCLIAAATMVLGGCASAMKNRIEKKHKELSTELCEVATDFTRRLVWKDFDGAGMLVVPEKQVPFFEKADQVASKLSIEDFKLALCQVSMAPFARDEDLPEPGDDPIDEPIKPPAAVVSQTPEGVETNPSAAKAPVPDKTIEKQKLKMPKVFYGVALVRLINVTVAPSTTVQNKLMKQYWIWTNDHWMCDMDVEELLE